MQNNKIDLFQVRQGINLIKSGIKTLQSEEMKHINELNPELVTRGNELLNELENIKTQEEFQQIFTKSQKLASDHQKKVSLYLKEMEEIITLSEKSLKNMIELKDINISNSGLLNRTKKLSKTLEDIKYKTDLNQKILKEKIVDPLNQLKKDYVEAQGKLQNSFVNFVQQPKSNQTQGLGQ